MEMKELTPEAIDHIMKNMDETQLRSPWARGFFPNVKDQWERIRWLSDNQKLKLGELWDQQS